MSSKNNGWNLLRASLLQTNRLHKGYDSFIPATSISDIVVQRLDPARPQNLGLTGRGIVV